MLICHVDGYVRVVQYGWEIADEYLRLLSMNIPEENEF